MATQKQKEALVAKIANLNGQVARIYHRLDKVRFDLHRATYAWVTSSIADGDYTNVRAATTTLAARVGSAQSTVLRWYAAGELLHQENINVDVANPGAVESAASKPRMLAKDRKRIIALVNTGATSSEVRKAVHKSGSSHGRGNPHRFMTTDRWEAKLRDMKDELEVIVGKERRIELLVLVDGEQYVRVCNKRGRPKKTA
jgi:hypothetical protein